MNKKHVFGCNTWALIVQFFYSVHWEAFFCHLVAGVKHIHIAMDIQMLKSSMTE